ncbi:cell adhesion molecule 4 [Dromaius novaehollandiae]|uniref:cell adhesion molecule 4 n=1 Tax=Dromaius novaehollandiae TaxID=8790 RepID=UPI00311E746F
MGPAAPLEPLRPPLQRRRQVGSGAGTRRSAMQPRPGSRRRHPALPPLLLPALLLACAPPAGRAQEVQAENVTVAEGSTAEITCRLHHYDGSIVVIQNPARQTLFFNGTRALKDERFQLAEFTQRQVRIQLAGARLEDEGGYFCQLYTEDTHHQIATLTVLVPPESPVVEAAGAAVEGAEVELSCLVPRSRPPATLRWLRDRRELQGVSSREQLGKVFRLRNVLRFRVERKDHGAIVTCEATHPALRGQRRQTQYMLDVQYAPSVRLHPSQSVLREGDTLVLTCAVTGNPRPTEIAWSRANESLPGRARAEGEVLTLPALSPLDNGTYSCAAANRHGRAAAHYSLVVYDPGAVVAAQSSVPYAIVGGILALLVFLVICVLIAMVWCSIRQKGSYLTHEASGLDEHGEAREAFLNGADGHKRKEEFFI